MFRKVRLMILFSVSSILFITIQNSTFFNHEIWNRITWVANGNEALMENKVSTDDRTILQKAANDRMELVDIKDNDEDVDAIKRSLVTKSVVYDVDVLHEELLKTHSELYDSKTGDECVLRDPKCVVLGVAKSGTQEFVDFSSLHPNIVLKPGLAPPEMFHRDKSIRIKSIAREKKYPMPCSYSDQIAIAKTDDYLFRPGMPETLHAFNPDLKMVLVVREPVARMISGYSFHYLQTVQHKTRFVYKAKDVPAMDNVFVNESNGQVKMNHNLDLSMYHVGMERYLKLFPVDQIMIIETNEFTNDPVGVLQRFETFLNLKPVFNDSFFTFVKDKGFYCLNKDKIYCYGSDRGRAVMRKLRSETTATLKSFFKPLNEKFFDLIGKRFDW